MIAPDVEPLRDRPEHHDAPPLWVEEIQLRGRHRRLSRPTARPWTACAWRRSACWSEPELIVSGINHGANLGDDITYSGTVAAALEGVVLGVPAIAVLAAVDGARDGLPVRQDVRLRATALVRRPARAGSELPLPHGTLLNVNCPRSMTHSGARVTRLGKRVYRDKLELDEEDDSAAALPHLRRRPVLPARTGTDFAAIDDGMIVGAPLHFDLTDGRGLEELGGFDLDER